MCGSNAGRVDTARMSERGPLLHPAMKRYHPNQGVLVPRGIYYPYWDYCEGQYAAAPVATPRRTGGDFDAGAEQTKGGFPPLTSWSRQ